MFIFLSEIEVALEEELIALGDGALVQTMTRWERRGWEKGREEGQRILLLQLLIRRCGTLSPSLNTQVQALPSTEVQALSEALFDFTSPADLEHWRATRPTP